MGRRCYMGAKSTHANDGGVGDNNPVSVLEVAIGCNVGLGFIDELGPVVHVNSFGIKR